jgi:hypothetical protein
MLKEIAHGRGLVAHFEMIGGDPIASLAARVERIGGDPIASLAARVEPNDILLVEEKSDPQARFARPLAQQCEAAIRAPGGVIIVPSDRASEGQGILAIAANAFDPTLDFAPLFAATSDEKLIILISLLEEGAGGRVIERMIKAGVDRKNVELLLSPPRGPRRDHRRRHKAARSPDHSFMLSARRG